jgi:PPK2 family polyphosphate:nucleotide phosphotransferase
MFEQLRIEPSAKVSLAAIDPDATPGYKQSKRHALDKLEALSRRLTTLQGMFWAERKRKLLVVLQGMDTSGKDGTIAHVFESVNPLGVKAVAWKAPSEQELAHDFLWRIHAQVPGAGEMAIFNRSHYESVTTERVRELVPPAVWRRRYQEINDFERLLTQSGTVVLKFFLHIDRAEQKRRLVERLDDPAKRWKFQRSDVDDRRLWSPYMRAYEQAIERTSTKDAPWYVVPANRKWFRNLVVASVLVHTLEQLDLRFPEPVADLSNVVIE